MDPSLVAGLGIALALVLALVAFFLVVDSRAFERGALTERDGRRVAELERDTARQERDQLREQGQRQADAGKVVVATERDLAAAPRGGDPRARRLELLRAGEGGAPADGAAPAPPAGPAEGRAGGPGAPHGELGGRPGA